MEFIFIENSKQQFFSFGDIFHCANLLPLSRDCRTATSTRAEGYGSKSLDYRSLYCLKRKRFDLVH